MAVYRVMIPIKVYGADDALKLARQYANNGDQDAAQIMEAAAEAIRAKQLKPLDNSGDGNVYIFGAGR